MPKYIPVFIISILLGAALFTSLRYATIAREKAEVESELTGIKKEIALLEAHMKEAQDIYSTLSQEKASLLDILKGLEYKITQQSSKNTLSQKHLFLLIGEIKGLRNDKMKLSERIMSLEQQNSQLTTKLGSVTELKKAIKGLQKEMRENKLAMAVKMRHDTMLKGNLGYIVKDGVSTYSSRIAIEVKSIE